jgi:hypothetical protein
MVDDDVLMLIFSHVPVISWAAGELHCCRRGVLDNATLVVVVFHLSSEVLPGH